MLLDYLILTSLLGCILFLYLYFTRSFNYWKLRGTPFEPPIPYFGNALDIITLKKSIGIYCQAIYEKYTGPFVGLYILKEPYLLIRDPEMVKAILVRDSEYFMNRSMHGGDNNDPIGSNILFLMKKNDWQQLRKKMTPVFTSGKLKLMYKLIMESSKNLESYLLKHVKNEKVLEVKELCGKFTTDIITSTAFGIKSNCFENENDPFRCASRRIFNWDSFLRGFQMTCHYISPIWIKLFKMSFIDNCSGKFFMEVFSQALNERKTSGKIRNDIVDILNGIMESQDKNDSYQLDDIKILAQGTQFFLAGTETTSGTLVFTFYELAQNKYIQNRLREEIMAIKDKYGIFTYEGIKEMTYLDMVMLETLRKYPSLPLIDRRCTKPYIFPGTECSIEEGVGVYVSCLGLHNDPNYFPEPNKFDPDRFSEENKDSIPPGAFLPFGDGPRNCLGARFGALSFKSAVIHILLNYELLFCDETPKDMKFHNNAFLLAPATNISLKFKKICN